MKRFKFIQFVLISLFIFSCNQFTHPSAAQAASKTEKFKQGIVKISVHRPDDNIDTGAGIIVSVDSQYVYIITALHVLAGEDDDLEDINIAVNFYSSSHDSIPAKVFPQFDEDLDLAVITVEAQNIADFEVRPTLKIGDLAAMNELNEIITLGHPSNISWQLSPGNIGFIETLHVQFSGDAVYPGNSGGALLDGKMNLIGIVTHRTAESASAVTIDIALDKLNEWNVPIQLEKAKASKKWWYIGGGAAALLGGALAILGSGNGTDGETENPVLGRPPAFP